MGLMDLIRGTAATPGDALAVAVEAATKAFLTAQATLRDADAAWLEALADEQLGKGSETAVAAADKDLARAQAEFDKAERALKAVQHRQEAEDRKKQESEDRAAAKAKAEPWNAAIATAEARAKAAEDLARAASGFADAYHALLDMGHTLSVALPSDHDRYAIKTLDPLVEQGIRLELYRLGVGWAFSGWSAGKDAIPDFTEAYRDTPGMVRKWKNQAIGRG